MIRNIRKRKLLGAKYPGLKTRGSRGKTEHKLDPQKAEKTTREPKEETRKIREPKEQRQKIREPRIHGRIQITGTEEMT